MLRVGDAALPTSKYLLIVGGESFTLSGLVVYTPMTGKVYIPRDAVRLIYKHM